MLSYPETPKRTSERAIANGIRVTRRDRVEGATVTRISCVLYRNCQHGQVNGETRGHDLWVWIDGEHVTDAMPSYVTTHDETVGWARLQVAVALAAQWEALAS